jgi:POT family proton-dependent oligopeptide transporter
VPPVPWLQSVDALGVIVLVLPMLRFWRWQAVRSCEPNDVTKLAIGCLLFGVAIAWLAGGELVADATGKEPLIWAFVYHFLSAIGYLYFAPVAVAVFSRTAPSSVNAMMIGTYYLSIIAGSTISGRLGGLYERLSSAQFAHPCGDRERGRTPDSVVYFAIASRADAIFWLAATCRRHRLSAT